MLSLLRSSHEHFGKRTHLNDPLSCDCHPAEAGQSQTNLKGRSVVTPSHHNVVSAIVSKNFVTCIETA